VSILVVLPLLGISRLLPAHGFGLWVRLAAATLLLFLPGWYVARALRTPGSASGFVWSVALAAGALAITFAAGGSLTLTLVVVLAAGAVALPFSRRSRPRVTRAHGLVALAGIALGLALWSLEGIVAGDGLFHLGRMRKLDDFGSLSLRAVDEFRDGGLHPGYAFPLWHAWLALVAKIAGVDPTEVLRHESSLLVPLALVLAYEMGRQVFRSTWPALVVLAAQVGMIALAPGSGGSYTTLALPGTTARQLFVPAVIALFFRFVRGPSWPVGLTLSAAGVGLAFVHPTYALFVVIPLFGFALVRLLVTTEDLRPSALALTAFGAPVLLVFAWLAPIVSETRSHTPTAKAKAQGFAHYAGDLVISSPVRYHLEPSLVARTGAIAVASLVLVPLAAFAARRRWSAFVLGGMVIVLALELAPFIFPRFSDLVSLSQSRRAAGFVPFAFALAGGMAVLARSLRLLVLPAALAAGIVLQVLYPGDFELRSHHGGPALATWIALWGGVAGIVAAAALVRIGGGRYERPHLLGGLAGLLFVLPVAVYGFAHWDEEPQRDAYALTPGLVSFLRTHVPERAIVYADLETSYRISAYAPVYVADAPPTHVADTTANRPAARRRDLMRFLRTGDLSIPRGYGAGWLVLGRGELPGLHGRVVYRDAAFRVLRL
jgi:hypothetical protein